MMYLSKKEQQDGDDRNDNFQELLGIGEWMVEGGRRGLGIQHKYWQAYTRQNSSDIDFNHYYEHIPTHLY